MDLGETILYFAMAEFAVHYDVSIDFKFQLTAKPLRYDEIAMLQPTGCLRWL